MPNLMKNISFSGNHKDCCRTSANLACEISKRVIHTSIRDEFPEADRKLHPPSGIIGKLATETGAGTLVLSQFMARSLLNVEENL
jgi:hypothetical protein